MLDCFSQLADVDKQLWDGWRVNKLCRIDVETTHTHTTTPPGSSAKATATKRVVYRAAAMRQSMMLKALRVYPCYTWRLVE